MRIVNFGVTYDEDSTPVSYTHLDVYKRQKVNALSKDPMLEMRTAVSLYLEDLVVENLGLEQSREVMGNKVVPIQKAM